MTKSKNTHTVTLPNGEAATRTSTSGRAYAFAVAYRDSYPATLAAAKGDHCDVSNYAFHVREAKRLPGDYQIENQFRPGTSWTQTVTAEQHQQHLDEIEGCADAQAYHAKKVAERVAKVEARKAAGGFETWCISGWQSRADLAQKEAARLQAGGWAVDVTILPATMVTK